MVAERKYSLNGEAANLAESSKRVPIQLSFSGSEFPYNIVYLGNQSPQGSDQKPDNDFLIGPTIETEVLEGFQSEFLVFEGNFRELKPNRVLNPGDFGGGRLGRSAFSAVIYSERGCERIISEDPLKRCGNEPTQTLDFDVMGSADHILICGEECFIATEEIVTRDLKNAGSSYSAVGKNGRGRDSWTR